MIITTTEEIKGYKIKQAIGLVAGNTVRSKWFGKDIIAGFRNLVGGEVKEYTEMMTEARTEAIQRMEKDAQDKGADAVIMMRFGTASITEAATEFIAYGTGVKLEKEKA